MTIAIAFGVLPVCGAAWLQSGVLDGSSLLISIPMAFWVASILLINEVPDIAADAAAGKGTLPVRVGIPGTRVIYLALHLGALAAIVGVVATGMLRAWALIVPPLLLVLAVANSRAVRPVSDGREALKGAIERTLAIHTIGGLWLALWAWFGG